MSTSSATALSVKLLAARAAKLADDIDRGRLWEGEITNALRELSATLDDAIKHNTDRAY